MIRNVILCDNIIITLYHYVNISTMSVIPVFCFCKFMNLTFLWLFFTLMVWHDATNFFFYAKCLHVTWMSLDLNKCVRSFLFCLLLMRLLFQKIKWKHSRGILVVSAFVSNSIKKQKTKNKYRHTRPCIPESLSPLLHLLSGICITSSSHSTTMRLWSFSTQKKMWIFGCAVSKRKKKNPSIDLKKKKMAKTKHTTKAKTHKTGYSIS